MIRKQSLSVANKKKVLHIFHDVPHHYNGMMRFFNKDVVKNSKQIECAYVAHSLQERFSYLKLYKRTILKASCSQAVIFHGMWDIRFWPLLFLVSIMTPATWVCWGADIHNTYEKNGVKVLFKKVVKRLFSSNLKKVITLNHGDKDIVKKQIPKNKEVVVLPYPLIQGKSYSSIGNNEKICKVLLGNSASKENKHVEILQVLSKYSTDDLLIYVPLNYAGTKKYVDDVIAFGVKCFGDKFHPITEMLDKSEYDTLINQCSVVILGHKRQQGLYAAYSALLNRANLYLSRESSVYQEFGRLGMKLEDFESIEEKKFKDFSNGNASDLENNKRIMLENYSEKQLSKKWNALFFGLIK